MLEEDKYKNKYRISSARLTGWDYSSNDLYFVTICTKDRVRYFGEIIDTQDVDKQNSTLQETEIGQIAINNWLQIPTYAPFVELGEFVIMPDHIHGILQINKPEKEDWQGNKFGSQSQNLASIIRGYKSSVKTYSTIKGIDFVWQAGYHDRVVRNEKEHVNIAQYIYDNPAQWLLNNGVENESFYSL